MHEAKQMTMASAIGAASHTTVIPLPCESAASQYRVGLIRFTPGRVLVFHGGVFGCLSRMNGKPSSPVLRGLGASNGARPLDPNLVMSELLVIRPESATSVNEASNLPEADPLGRKQDFIGFQKNVGNLGSS
jgi:hypothetical protein